MLLLSFLVVLLAYAVYHFGRFLGKSKTVRSVSHDEPPEFNLVKEEQPEKPDIALFTILLSPELIDQWQKDRLERDYKAKSEKFKNQLDSIITGIKSLAFNNDARVDNRFWTNTQMSLLLKKAIEKIGLKVQWAWPEDKYETFIISLPPYPGYPVDVCSSEFLTRFMLEEIQNKAGQS